jgi:hypothetical protein
VVHEHFDERDQQRARGCTSHVTDATDDRGDERLETEQHP